MREPIEGGPCETFAAQYLGPVLEGQVRGDDETLTPMGTYTQLEMAELGHAVDRLPTLTSQPSDAEDVGDKEAMEQQLAQVIAAWNQLSEEVRASILKLLV